MTHYSASRVTHYSVSPPPPRNVSCRMGPRLQHMWCPLPCDGAQEPSRPGLMTLSHWELPVVCPKHGTLHFAFGAFWWWWCVGEGVGPLDDSDTARARLVLSVAGT